MYLRIFIFLAAVLLLPVKNAAAQQLSLSAGVFSVQSEYRGSDARVLPMPVVRYEGERFFIRNTEAGVWLWNDGTQKFSIGATLLPQYFRSSKSDDQAMKQLDNRNIIVLGTLGYELNTDFGSLKLCASGDITGTSDGFLLNAAYIYPITFGALTIMPNGGLLYSSSNFNEYYYGISHGEARRSGLAAYSPDGSLTPFVGVSANYAVTSHWSLFASWKVIFLSNEIKDSPMVDRSAQNILGGGLTYTF